MKRALIILTFALAVTACNNSAENKTTTDSSSINTNSSNVSDGGPNNGAGDTTDYSRMNDKVKDSSGKDTTPK